MDILVEVEKGLWFQSKLKLLKMGYIAIKNALWDLPAHIEANRVGCWDPVLQLKYPPF